MSEDVTIKQKGELGQDIWLECYVSNSLTRKILFSVEMQDDLDDEVHEHIILDMNNELTSNPEGPNLKISPVQNRSHTGASKKDFCFTKA